MLGLLYKDLTLIKKNAIQILFGSLVFILPLVLFPFQSMEEENVQFLNDFLVVICFLTSFLVLSTFEQGNFEQDERRVWTMYVSSLPNGRRNHIAVKYITPIMFHMAYFIICFVIDTIFCKINNIEGNHMLLYGGLTLLGIAFKAIEIPFYIGFGIKTGNSIKIFIIFAILMVVFVVILFGDSEFFFAITNMDKLTNYLSRKIIAFAKTPKIYLALKYTSIVLGTYIASFFVSCKIFRFVGKEI